MKKIRLSPDEYDAVVEKYRTQNGYDDMSDEEKAEFDGKLDKVIERDDGDDSEPEESTDNLSDSEKLRLELKAQYGYGDMSDEQKAAFDKKLDEVVGSEVSDDEDSGENEIGARVLRRSR